jgi:hypothetical protein
MGQCALRNCCSAKIDTGRYDEYNCIAFNGYYQISFNSAGCYKTNHYNCYCLLSTLLVTTISLLFAVPSSYLFKSVTLLIIRDALCLCTRTDSNTDSEGQEI